MSRAALPALVVLLVLVTTSVAPPSSAASTTREVAPETAILTLEGSTRSGIATPGTDVGRVLSMGHDATAERLDRYAFEERLQRAGESTRTTMVASALDRLETRVRRLNRTERAVRRAYWNGSIDASRFLRRVAAIQSRAERIEAWIALLEANADAVDFSVRSETTRLRDALLGLRGPVRSRALSAFRGHRSSVPIYVEASENGVVLSVVEANHHLREADRADHRRIENTTDIGLSQAIERFRELYPVASEDNTGLAFWGSQSPYRVNITLQQGWIVAHLDGATGDVFFEVQRRELDRLSRPASVTRAANGTRLVVNRTYPGGPLRIATYDNATGEPVDAIVEIGRTGQRIATGSDGVAWGLSPDVIQFKVTATRDGATVSAPVRPLAERPLGYTSGSG